MCPFTPDGLWLGAHRAEEAGTGITDHTPPMTTTEVAARYYELAQRGQIPTIQDELYALDAVSIEPDNPYGLPHRVEGIQALREKEDAFEAFVDEWHGGYCGAPVVADPFFACTMGMDVTMKGQPRRMKEQVGVFQVTGGKVVREEFFYVDAAA